MDARLFQHQGWLATDLFGEALQHKPREIHFFRGPPEKIALQAVGAEFGQRFGLGRCFNSLRGDFEPNIF